MIPPGQVGLISSTAIAVCAIMAVVNLARYKSRGAAAIAMALAFITLGITVWMIRENFAKVFVYAGAVVTGVLLFIDFGLRAAKQSVKR